jgi:hypothetical protein
MKLIELYKEWMEKGEIPGNGICWSIPEEYLKDIRLFQPTCEEELQLFQKGLSSVYWGSGVHISKTTLYNLKHKFTSLRQTIVLLICAMNDEI